MEKFGDADEHLQINAGAYSQILIHQPLHLPHNPRVQLAEVLVSLRVTHTKGLEGGAELAQRMLVVRIEDTDDAG